MFSTNKFKNTNNLYYIGGVVRDEILDKESFDVDLTYVGNAIEYVKTLPDIEIIQTNDAFGTVRIKIDNQEIDIASTRSEIYEKAGHLPTVRDIGCELKTDVLRRDFTINAIAKNYNTSEIIDYTGGLNDIKEKKIRVLHDKSFIDDPTRIIRALKFSVRFNFELEKHTRFLRDKYLQNINYDMSYKRLKKELIETFNLNSQKAYDEFVDSGIYKLVTPKTISAANHNIEATVKKYLHLFDNSNIWLIYVATLEDLSNLESTLTKEELRIINDYTVIKNQLPKNDFETYKLFNNCKIETVLLYAILQNKEIAEKYLDNLINIKIDITGDDLLALGVIPSAKIKDCFDFILDNKIKDSSLTRNQELDLAKKFFKL